MLHYLSRGSVPAKPHTVFRDARGKLLYEECFTRRGFDTPLGRRVFDLKPISARADSTAEIAAVEADGS